MIENMTNHIHTVRSLTIQALNHINLDYVSTIPEGFHNNIHWNLGHIAYIQERLTFKLNGQEMQIPKSYEEFFAAGTAPDLWTGTPPTILEIKTVLQEQPKRIKPVIESKFNQPLPTPFKNKMGVTLQSVGECILFSTFHEGMHLETIKRIYKHVRISKP